jgi:glycosyltransferase involved in cell wall biosynthesis
VVGASPKPNYLNFHRNKQTGLLAATGDIIFQIDADEVPDAELLQWLMQLKQQTLKHIEQVNGWWVPRRNFFLGTFLTKGGQYPDPVLRIYRRGRGYLPAKDVHEQLEVDGQTAWASGHLLHYSSPTFADYLRKFNHYTTFRASQMEEWETSVSMWSACVYFLWKPVITFCSLYMRHRGFVDGVPGFVFAVMSGVFHAVAYLKYWERLERQSLKLPKATP